MTYMIPYSHMRNRFTQQVIICLGVFLCLFTLTMTKIDAASIADFQVPESFRFSKKFQYGAYTSPDVYYLQNILNLSTSTRVAETGIGSNQSLSTYYGNKTRDGVNRFQTLFAVDIDYEKSISTSTATSTTVISSSTLDVFTRAVLNKLIIIYSGDRDRYYEYLRTGTTTATTEETIPEEVLAAEEEEVQTTKVQTETEVETTTGTTTETTEEVQAETPAEEETYTEEEGYYEEEYGEEEEGSYEEEDTSVESSASKPKKTSSKKTTKSKKSSSVLGKIKMPHEVIYQGKKTLFTYSPGGQILKAIGGQALVDKVFSYTPAGQIKQLGDKLTGNSTSGTPSKGALGAVAGIGALALFGGAAADGAKTAVAPLNFGGESTSMVTCTCSSNLLIYVHDVRGPTLPLIYQPGATILYKMYRPTAGVNMLGQYISGGQCMVYAVVGCVSGGTPVGTMIQLGTSLTIGKK
jgi:hypothetical protein